MNILTALNITVLNLLCALRSFYMEEKPANCQFTYTPVVISLIAM